MDDSSGSDAMTRSPIRINQLTFTRFSSIHFFLIEKMINQYFNHVDEVTVNRDKLSVLLWEQTGPLTSDLPAEAPFDWLWLRDHKHSPWA